MKIPLLLYDKPSRRDGKESEVVGNRVCHRNAVR
jgi:hypothetical protein